MSEEVKKTVDRSKYKGGTSVAAAQADEQKAQELAGKKGGFAKNAEYVDLKGPNGSDKTTILRIYGPHGKIGPYAVPKGIRWIPTLVAKKDSKGEYKKDADGKFIKDTWENRPWFDAKIHGGQKEDIGEEYVKFADKLANDMYGTNPTDEKAKSDKYKYLEPVKGSVYTKGVKPKYNGLGIKLSSVSYVNEIIESGENVTKKFSRAEWPSAVKQRLNHIAASESSNDPLGTDPFTDADDGIAVKVTYNSKATKAQDYYMTEKHNPAIPNSGGRCKLYPLTDEEILHFEEQPSLQKLFVNVYDVKTFDAVVAGLKHFDEEHEIGVFEYDEFKEKINELRSKLPEAPNEEGNGETVAVESKGDVYDNMDRDELKEFNKANKLGLIPNKTMTDDDLRVAIRAAMALKDEPVKEKEPETEDEEPDGPETTIQKQEVNDLPWDKNGNDIRKVEETAPLESKPAMSAKDRIAALKNKGK